VQAVEVEAPRVLVAQVRLLNDIAAPTEMVTDWVDPFRVAVTVELKFVRTATAAAVNVAEVAPAGTRTDGGTVRAVVRLLARATLDPPAGAAWDSVTVQVVTARAMRLVLPQASELIESAAVIAIVTDFEDPLSVAVRFAL